MPDDRHMTGGGVVFRLLKRLVDVERLRPLAFDMDVDAFEHDIWRVGAALVLDATA